MDTIYIVETIAGSIKEMDLAGKILDPVKMDHLQMQKPHQKVTSQGGRQLGISLEPGEGLFQGALLMTQGNTLVYAELLPEQVFEIYPKGELEWGIAAYNIGNMHQPAYFCGDCIRIPFDPLLERMLLQTGIPYRVTMAKLDGLRPNKGVGHSHGDGHPSHHHGE